MIDPENLRTASLYINNQLLSRGLLRDGHSIDFAHPGDTEGEVSETMSRIISVVNDLILRRDRDAEHRESLSTTLRALRAESLRQANDIQRLQEKCADAQRKAGISEAAEASLRTQLRSAEANIHRLKEEAARTRTLVAQTRAACANEVRKRDRQIESLKKAVAEAGRARGAGKAVGVTSITVVGDVGGEPEVVVPGAEGQHGGVGDLRAETNAFLAQLAKSLSEENENLLALIRRTVEQLKDMSGWDTVAGAGCGVQGEHGDGHALVLAANPADLAYEVDEVLEHLRTILTNPSFVPIEEVVVREDEIHRLRDGWEKMESRWKEAVHLIDGWRKRMQNSGRPVNVEELKMGLRLSPVKVKNVEETAHGYNLKLESGEDEEDDEEDGDGRPRTPSEEGPLDLVPEQHDAEAVDSEEEEEGEFDEDDDVDVDELDVEEPNVEILQHSLMMASPPYLRETRTSANRGPRPGRHHNKKHSRLFPAITEEKTYEVDTEEDPIPPPPPPHAEKPRQSPKKPLLSLRPVPPEEAAEVALPPSAALSAPDGWTNSPSDPTPEERVSKASAPAKLEPRAAAASAAAATTKRREAAKKTDAAVPAKRDPTARRPVTTTKRKDTDPTKPTTTTTRTTTATGPTAATTAKLRTAAQRPPITRGRSDTRSDDKQSTTSTGTAPTTRPARAPSSASASSARSAATTTNNGKHTTIGDPTASPTRRPNPSPAPSPTRSPQRGVNSRLPLPRPERAANGAVTATASGSSLLPPPQQSPVNMATIAAKLAASEREADAARVRAKLKAARSAAGSKGCATAAPVTLPPRPPSCVEGGEQGDAAQWGSLNRSCEAASLVAAASTSSSSGSGSGSGCGSASSSVEDGSRPRSVATAATGASSSASSFKEEGEGGEECDKVDMVEDDEEGEEDGVAGEEGVNQDDEEQEEEDELGLSPVERPQQPAPTTQAQGRKERQPLRKDKTSSKQTLAVQKRTQKQASSTTNTTQGAAVKRTVAPAKLPAATTADGGLVPPRKRERRTSKIAGAGGGSSSSSRRRSTLSPWELDALIQGGTVTVDR
ncbi:hypothetical protein VTJ04DRAFT_9858 [Mycothermus thermophilus]|uniref:uncharacterized protein n=1 Tax=Humicola insolens TaxID=85995 RepID=UPI003741FB68